MMETLADIQKNICFNPFHPSYHNVSSNKIELAEKVGLKKCHSVTSTSEKIACIPTAKTKHASTVRLFNKIRL
jgi:hypothetical protein